LENKTPPFEVEANASPHLSKRVIKRYANRKLYDTRDSRYITLSQVAEFVRQGEDLLIIDNATKEDLTSVTLAQVIYQEEEQKKGDDGRAQVVGTLRSLIQQGRGRIVATLRDNVHHLVDDRVRAFAGGAVSPVHQLQSEVKRLADRIKVLEAKLRDVAKGGASRSTLEQPSKHDETE